MKKKQCTICRHLLPLKSSENFHLKRSKMMRGLLFTKGPVLETSTFVTYNTGLLWVCKV